jgi:hypothetical protein
MVAVCVGIGVGSAVGLIAAPTNTIKPQMTAFTEVRPRLPSVSLRARIQPMKIGIPNSTMRPRPSERVPGIKISTANTRAPRKGTGPIRMPSGLRPTGARPCGASLLTIVASPGAGPVGSEAPA